MIGTAQNRRVRQYRNDRLAGATRTKWLGLFAGLGLLLAATSCAREPYPMRRPEHWRAAMQPPLSEEASQALAAGPTLYQALALGLSRNPAVQAARLEWLAAIHREPQAYTPPDPMVNELMFDFEMDIFSKIRPMLPLPWPQKLWAKGRIAARHADIARLRYELAMRERLVEIKDSYYELYYIDQAATITSKIEEAFRRYSILAYQELSAGRTQLNEAFRAESQAAQLAYDRILLAEQRGAQAERLKALLNLPSATAIGPIRSAPTYPIAESVQPLYERAERLAEVLKIRGLELENSRHEVLLARLARVPDFSVGADITSLDSASLPTDFYKGSRSYEGMLSFNLPLWEWRNQAMVREKKAMREAAEWMAMEELNQLRRSVAGAWFDAKLSDRLIHLYEEALLPQAEAVMDQAEILFRSDQASFSNLLESTLAYHNFLLAHRRAISNYGQALGRLERVLGATAESKDMAMETGQ